jgi:GTPase SAR1 family protein
MNGKGQLDNFKRNGADIFIKDITVEEQNRRSIQRLEIWDTNGQEKYRSIPLSHYRDADAFILVFGF